MVDTTGSMTDDLEWLTRDLEKIVQSARSAAPGVDIRQGLILYRDEGDDYVVRNLGFTHKAGTMKTRAGTALITHIAMSKSWIIISRNNPPETLI